MYVGYFRDVYIVVFGEDIDRRLLWSQGVPNLWAIDRELLWSWNMIK